MTTHDDIAKKRPGRPTSFDPEKARRIVELLGAGNFVETAASAVGVTSRTVRNWLKAGEREANSEVYEFWLDVEQARARAEIQDMRAMVDPNNPHWVCNAWLLERRHPGHWRRKKSKPKRRLAKTAVPRPLAEIEAEINSVLASLANGPPATPG